MGIGRAGERAAKSGEARAGTGERRFFSEREARAGEQTPSPLSPLPLKRRKMKIASAVVPLAVVLGVLASAAPLPAQACEDLFSFLDCSAGSCWSPTANTSFLDSVLLPAANNASTFLDEAAASSSAAATSRPT